ncbi:reticulocyte-binding protein 2 a [Podospora australis]|uniref:Reticulocyte-binding protein 2 a n=1 Tax=Podospora australis TaxID=1536484 RepID=A0AAN6X141_9PEZI|nr:reticulocyte-binding protein 2 a [Podospora australis]
MAHHEPFKALGPLSWQEISAGGEAAYADVLQTTFSNCELLINSIPAPASTTKTGRARAQTDSAVSSSVDTNHILGSAAQPDVIAKLKKDWKEVKTSAKDQTDLTRGISVYKLSSKDGKGAWFARRSIHRDTEPFEKWEAALRKEFAETLERCADGKKEPGTGNIRGIGAERVVEKVEVEGKGVLELFQVSARFPGPTTPRDFLALHMSPPRTTPEEEEKKKKRREPRQFMLVSRPCEHPDCPPRSGFIRGTYESVEMIREVPMTKPLRRTRSDLGKEDVNGLSHSDNVSRDAVLRSAQKAEATGHRRGVSNVESVVDDEDDDVEMAIEWLMVTRSDPGGSVPRFLVEKGTPGGIMNDAGSFLKWFMAEAKKEEAGVTADRESLENGTIPEEEHAGEEPAPRKPSTTTRQNDGVSEDTQTETNDGDVTPPSGFYGMIASAIGAAASRVATLAGTTVADDDSETDTTSSDVDYASAEEGDEHHSPASSPIDATDGAKGMNASNFDVASTLSRQSTISEVSQDISLSSRDHTPDARKHRHEVQHEKELRKLQDRMRRAQAKLVRAQEAKRQAGDFSAKEKEREEEALRKVREKHEKELAKREEKYQRELRRIADKRAAEEKKAADKARKAAEREEKAIIQMDLERTRIERDVALKQIEILREQVGELQAQNTVLVARLGKEGVVLKGDEFVKAG